MILLKIAFISLFPIVLCEKVKRQEQVIHEIPKFKRGREFCFHSLLVSTTFYSKTEVKFAQSLIFLISAIVIVDETALTNPNSFDYDFSDDLGNTADKQDLYDQFIDQLPMFHIYKLGTDRGVTQVREMFNENQRTWKYV